MNRNKIFYWIVTGLFCAFMLMGASMYVLNNDHVAQEFIKLGFPLYLIYPMAVAKVLGVLALIGLKNKSLKEWAYAGFFFEISLAISAHLNVGDCDHMVAVVAMVLLIASYFIAKKNEIV